MKPLLRDETTFTDQYAGKVYTLQLVGKEQHQHWFCAPSEGGGRKTNVLTRAVPIAVRRAAYEHFSLVKVLASVKAGSIPTSWLGLTKDWPARNLLLLLGVVNLRRIPHDDLDAVRKVWLELRAKASRRV